MPGTAMLRKIRVGLAKEMLDAVGQDEGLVERFAQPGSLVEIAREVLELEDWEVAYLADIPARIQEAIRAVVHDVIANPDAGLHLEVYYTPAYDFGVSIHEFDHSVVVHLQGPYTGQPYARQLYNPQSS